MILVAHDQTSEPIPYTFEQFAKVFRFKYVHHLTFENYKVEQWLKKKCEWAYNRGYIDKLNIWLGKLHTKLLDEEIMPDITIRWIGPDIGYGVYTNRAIKQWECIGEYAGIVRRRGVIRYNVNDYCFMYPRAWMTTKPYTIDSQYQGNFTRLVNHSDQPNLESISALHNGVYRVLLRAVRPIEAGEELSYDYGPIYWRDRNKVIY